MVNILLMMMVMMMVDDGYNHNLVGGFNQPLWKTMEWVTVGMIFHSQLFLESHKSQMFQTTNQ